MTLLIELTDFQSDDKYLINPNLILAIMPNKLASPVDRIEMPSIKATRLMMSDRNWIYVKESPEDIAKLGGIEIKGAIHG